MAAGWADIISGNKVLGGQAFHALQQLLDSSFLGNIRGMPLYEYVCTVCKEHQERYIPASDPRPDTLACKGCDGAAGWAGLSVAHGSFPVPTGAYTAQGQFVPGQWNQDAPLRKKRNIKRFK